MYKIFHHPQQRCMWSAGRDPADPAEPWAAGCIQAEASDLQRGEGVEGELGLVLVHKETLEVRQLVCGCSHRIEPHVSLLLEASSIAVEDASIQECDFELTLQESVRRRWISCGRRWWQWQTWQIWVTFSPTVEYLWLSLLWQPSSQLIIVH